MTSTCPDCKKTFQVLCECTRTNYLMSPLEEAESMFDYYDENKVDENKVKNAPAPAPAPARYDWDENVSGDLQNITICEIFGEECTWSKLANLSADPDTESQLVVRIHYYNEGKFFHVRAFVNNSGILDRHYARCGTPGETFPHHMIEELETYFPGCLGDDDQSAENTRSYCDDPNPEFNPFGLSRQKDFDAVTEFDQHIEEHLLLQDFSPEDQAEIREYATIHQLTIRESIEYQTHCHNCGKETPEGLISSGSHQYCSSRCQEYSETYCYSCVYEGECLVCANWADETVFEETVFDETVFV